MEYSLSDKTDRHLTSRALRFDDDEPPNSMKAALSTKRKAAGSRVEGKKDKFSLTLPSWSGKSIAELWQRYDLSKPISAHDAEEVDALSTQCNSGRKKPQESELADKKKQKILFTQEYDEAEWNRMFKLLLAFREKNQHTGVPPLWEKNPDLALWVQRQRQIYRETLGSNFQYRNFFNTKEASRMERLDSINFIWDYERFSWDIHYAKLNQIIEKVRKDNPDFQKAHFLPTLGKGILTDDLKTWIKIQIKSLEDPHELSMERQKQLAALFNMKDVAENQQQTK
ncbi:helicase domain protein [Nitzschia inconspicua]|uniref:Helicase domain protein n=1 Tax=Nitzschia inconspicua TaxID=303405 RepID=A0A9K3KSY4_9STRA|nr:helicase domain protein [Nitzschia inconspicua]